VGLGGGESAFGGAELGVFELGVLSEREWVPEDFDVFFLQA
jgi:hypothetical protein